MIKKNGETKKKAVGGKKRPSHKDEDSIREASASTTFSIRLTHEQRALIEEAAQLKGWTAATLIRTASIERAANIKNMREDKPGLLGEFADHICRQLFDTRLDYFDEMGGIVGREEDDLIEIRESSGSSPSESLMTRRSLEKVPDAYIYLPGVHMDPTGLMEDHVTVFWVDPEDPTDSPMRVIPDRAMSVEPERFLADDLITLRSALKLGGAEFLEQVIRCCERLLSAGARHEASISLREYVDPVSMASVTLSDYEKADLHEKRPSAAQGVPVGRGI
jgi:hypothetical protein